MRGTSRLFAAVKSAARYLEPGPTGLTGLTTHPAPRPALLYTYKRTLNKLEQIPKSSVYRQSVEAITNQRLAIVEATKPEGYDAWLARVQKKIEAHPEAYKKFVGRDGALAAERLYEEPVDNWDGVVTRADVKQEGSNDLSAAERKAQAVVTEVERVDREAREGVQAGVHDLEIEPPLTKDQIEDIEEKIGGGLIEEIVQVAEGELSLVEEMLASQPWEELEEQTPTGQWSYFERGERV